MYYTKNATFIAYSKDHRHDDAGSIFVPIVDHNTIYWVLATDRRLSVEDVYVRIYNDDGSISHYVKLLWFIEFLDYSSFCGNIGVQVQPIFGAAAIRRAIAEFLLARGIRR